MGNGDHCCKYCSLLVLGYLILVISRLGDALPYEGYSKETSPSLTFCEIFRLTFSRCGFGKAS